MIRNLFCPLSVILMSTALLFSQNDNRDISPFPGSERGIPINTLAMWDLEFSFNVTNASGASGNAGAEFDGTYIYTTRWASNLIHKFDMSGNLVEEFSIPGVTGLRDLAFDGTYMYGGAAANIIYQMDFNTKTLIGTISSPVAVRFIAYDEINDGFWCGSWTDDPTLVSRTGQTLNSFSTGLTHQYGAAFDDITTGGEYLWVFDQGGGVCPGSLIIYQFEIASGTFTGISHDACIDLTDGIAGGLFTTIDYIAGNFLIGGIMQSNTGLDDTFFLYDLSPCSVAPPSNPDPPAWAQNVPVNLAQLSWSNSPGDIVSELYFGTDPDSLTMVQGGEPDSSWSISSNYLPLEYLTTYYWMVINYGTPCYPTVAEWSFITEPDPTPVEFISFRSEVLNGRVILSWSTASETNNKGFEVGREVCSKQNAESSLWERIGFVGGNGTTSRQKDYSFIDKNVSAGTYSYRLKQVDFNGGFKFSDEIRVAVNTVYDFILSRNYPNPFNPVTNIRYEIPYSGMVTVKIYDVLGKEIATLVSEEKQAGSYSLRFDGSSLSGGVYFYQLKSGSLIKNRKMILLK